MAAPDAKMEIPMAYVDGFLLIVPTDKLGEYKKIATKAGKIWREHGAQGYVETSGDDMAVEGMQHFPKLMKAKDNETVVFSWIFYASKAERNRVNLMRVDAHAVLQRPQLLELLALLQYADRQRDETLQRRAAIGVEADMMPVRALAGRHQVAAEIERTADPAAGREGDDRLHDLRRLALLLRRDRRYQGSDIDLRFGKRRQSQAHRLRIERRQIALNIDDDLDPAIRIGELQRLVDAVRAGGQVRVGQDRASAPGLDRLDDLGIAGGDRHRQARGLGLAIGAHDHGDAADQGQRLVGQTGGRHTSGYHY